MSVFILAVTLMFRFARGFQLMVS